jgi:ubiquinone/menaquinone biosynthesis C-methylase UbiE
LLKTQPWDRHYESAKSELLYPDENLVRLLRKQLINAADAAAMTAIDLGCGSGRHLKLLAECGVTAIVGIDASATALDISRKHHPGPLLQGDNKRIPLKDRIADIVIAWGSLHYSNKIDLIAMLEEINRILKKDGCLFATLRSSRDTYLKKGRHLGNDTWVTDLPDVKGSTTSFYSEDEVKTAFSIFSEFSYGLIERTIMGDISSLISHWIIQSRK